MNIFLSPHEIATLFVVHNTPQQVNHADAEVVSLLRSELIKLGPAVSGCMRLATTSKGRELLKRLGLLEADMSVADVSAFEVSDSY